MDVQTRIYNEMKGVFIQRVQTGADGPEVIPTTGYRYGQAAILRRPKETEAELQTRCLETVAHLIHPPKAGLERPFALFSSIHESDDVQ